MTLRNQNRIKHLEATTRPQPYPEEHWDCSEAELVAMRDAARAALKGDRDAEAMLYKMLAQMDARRGLIEGPQRVPKCLPR